MTGLAVSLVTDVAIFEVVAAFSFRFDDVTEGTEAWGDTTDVVIIGSRIFVATLRGESSFFMVFLSDLAVCEWGIGEEGLTPFVGCLVVGRAGDLRVTDTLPGERRATNPNLALAS
jgi:hypothetical protein